ncbi:MAG: ATP-binding cassette domain-containing protein [bacterium]
MIEIVNLHFQYRNPEGAPVEVLTGIDLVVHAGESVALMGANGSGKTTLARCLNGLLQPTEGEVRIDGLNTNENNQLPEIRRRVGMVFQNPENQIVSATVEREVAFGLENLAVPHDQMHAIVAEMLRVFHLEPYRLHPPHLLSGGEMQRLALASVMAMRPDVIIFDEPTSLLDPASRALLLELIAQLHQRNARNQNPAVTPLFITQSPEEALPFERLLVLHKGKIAFDGAPVDVFQKVDELQEIGVPVPVEFEVAEYLARISRGKWKFDAGDFLAQAEKAK